MADSPPDVTEAVGSPLSSDASALWADFAPPLRAFLARRVPAGVEPDDLLQEVFLRCRPPPGDPARYGSARSLAVSDCAECLA